MGDDLQAMDPGRGRLVEIATVWRTAIAKIAYVPLSPEEMQGRFEQLTDKIFHALSTDQPADIEQSGRGIGRALVEMNLLKSLALERTLNYLGVELAGIGNPDLLRRLLVGISGGFAEATEAALLKQQESIGQAANDALRQAQKELATSRDHLANANRELSAQIAERISAEKIQREYAERLRRLHEIDLAMLSAETLPAIVDFSLDYVRHFIRTHSISILFIDSAANQSIILNSTNPHYPAGQVSSISQIETLNRLDEGHTIYIRDLRELREQSLELSKIADLGGRSLLVTPLRYQDKLIGGLSIVLDEVREFSDVEVAVAREIADSVTVAIQNRRLLEAERETNEREMTLRDMAASLTLGLKPADLSQRVLTQLSRVISYCSSSVFLLSDGILDMVAQQGDTKTTSRQIKRMLDKQPRSIWSVIETAQPAIINDTHVSPDWVSIPGFEFIRAWMGVPLLVKGECIGIITINRDEPNTFSDRDRDLAMAFANQAAIAIDNARLFDNQQVFTAQLERWVHERTREFELLYGITVAMVSNLDLQGLLERSLNLAMEAFNGLASAIYLVEGEESTLQLAALVELDPRIAATLRGLDGDEPILKEALNSDSPPVLNGSDLPAEWRIDGSNVFIPIPLRSSGRDLGLFCLVGDASNPPIDEMMPLLKTVVDQIAVGVENIRLRQIARQSAIIEERERLSREIHDAVTQSIYGIGLFAEVALNAADGGDLTKVRQRLQSILGMVDHALRELRLLLFELRTESLARLGLVGALKERIHLVESQAGIQTDVRAGGFTNLPVSIEETYYRIALEALNNSLRHARSERVEIDLIVEDGHLEMTIADQGIGFQRAAGDLGGMGLENMRKRIAKVNGVLTLESQIGVGTKVTVRAPLHQYEYTVDPMK